MLSGAFLFALENPGFIFHDGISFIAWFAYVPVFILIYRCSLKSSWIYGMFYGIFCYCFYVSWLVTFHPLGIFGVSAEYAVLLAPVFFLLSLSLRLFPKNGWIVQWVICVAYEYLKTTGYGGFNYGVTGYSQWKHPVLIQSADLFGVWGISALILFSSSLIAACIHDKSISRHKKSIAVWSVFFCLNIVYGLVSQKDYSSLKTVKVAAIQSNTDPWKGGLDSYKKDVRNLISITKEALETDPDIKIVVWPETAVVPAVVYNYDMRSDRERFELIDSFLTFVEETGKVFVVGNDHKVYRNGEIDDYNSALVFSPETSIKPPRPGIYKKIHLVPFTEYFPYQKAFPWLYKALIESDSHMWVPGSENTIFKAEGLSFCTPICFEDTFGSSVRAMYNAGGRAIINISNDAWSKSMSCQKQHLAMGLFRCIENRIPAVRATASGQTVFIAPNGRLVSEAPAFTEAFLIGELPVIPEGRKATLYSFAGDFFGQGAAVCALLMLVWGIFRICTKNLPAHKTGSHIGKKE